MGEGYGLLVSFGNYFPTMPEERAFVLGVEWQMVSDRIERGEMVHTVHTENVPLLNRLAASKDLLMEVAECEPLTDGWQLVRFGGADSGGQPKPTPRDAERRGEMPLST